MTKRELRAEIELRVKTEVFEAAIVRLEARVGELERREGIGAEVEHCFLCCDRCRDRGGWHMPDPEYHAKAACYICGESRIVRPVPLRLLHRPKLTPHPARNGA